jgi:acetyltransferase
MAEGIAEKAKEAWRPIISVWLGTTYLRKAREIFIQGNIPTYDTPEEAVRACLNMFTYNRNLELLYETPGELGVDEAPPKSHLRALIRRAVQEGRSLLSGAESKDFLRNYGIPVTTPTVVQNLEGTARKAHQIGYRVVLKIVSPDIPHRSDIGGGVRD